MPGSSVLFLAGLFAADPVFVDSAAVKVEGDTVTMQIVGEKPIDPTVVSGRIAPEGVGIYIEGGMGRPTNLQWQSNGLTIDARRRKDKVKLEMAFPAGTTCAGPVKIRGTEDGKIEAEFKCPTGGATVPAAGATIAVPKVASEVQQAKAELTTGAPTPVANPAAVEPKVAEPSKAQPTVAPAPQAPMPAPDNRWKWVVGAQALLIMVLLFRRKPAPPTEEPKVLPESPSPVSADPVKVLIVAEMEGRHFLLGATDSNTTMIREATAQWADQRTASEVLLTPIGGARSNRNTSTGSSESAEARLAAKVYGKPVR